MLFHLAHPKQRHNRTGRTLLTIPSSGPSSVIERKASRSIALLEAMVWVNFQIDMYYMKAAQNKNALFFVFFGG